MDGCRRRRRTDSPPPPSIHDFDYNHFISAIDGGRRRRRIDSPQPLNLHGFPYIPGYRYPVDGGDGRGRRMYVEYVDPPEGLNSPDRRRRYMAVTTTERVADDDATLRRQLPVVAPASGANCAICLQDLDPEGEDHEEATPRAMPCSHAFHERCIFQWIRRNRDCPLCRRTLPTPEQQEYSYDDDDRLQMTMPVPREMLEIEVL